MKRWTPGALIFPRRRDDDGLRSLTAGQSVRLEFEDLGSPLRDRYRATRVRVRCSPRLTIRSHVLIARFDEDHR